MNLSPGVLGANDVFQNSRASSMLSPTPLRKSPSCWRPPCLRWCSLCRALYNVRMHSGACAPRAAGSCSSDMPSEGPSPACAKSRPRYCLEMPPTKGPSRSLSWEDAMLSHWRDVLASARLRCSRKWEAARGTSLLAGTYAMPRCRNTDRLETSSGTYSKATFTKSSALAFPSLSLRAREDWAAVDPYSASSASRSCGLSREISLASASWKGTFWSARKSSCSAGVSSANLHLNTWHSCSRNHRLRSSVLQ
mmetsp:Transcript_30426/g.85180  ORF Transcript_30426/g.85180 Transcript_30426/m.85180 type:complete len:251 (-) Transcript_30426:305-1057(-)